MNTQFIPKHFFHNPPPNTQKKTFKSFDEPYRAYKKSTVVLFYLFPYSISVFLIYQFSKQYNSIDIIRIS